MSDPHHAYIPIWRGSRYCGKVCEARPSQYEAVDSYGQSLGRYNAFHAAANALLLKAAHPHEVAQ